MKNIHEHILACLSSAPSNANVIRTAAQMARAFGGTLTALYVQTKGADAMGADDRQRLSRHIRLAESLGADIATVTGDDVASQIAEFARLSKVTKIVLGRSSAPKNRLLAQKSLTEKLIELAPFLEIYIIPDIDGQNRRRRNPASHQPFLPRLRELALTAGITAACTLVGWLFQSLRFTEANTITVYILGVLLTARFTRNYLCSGLASLISVLLFNFFFTEPRLSFRAYESGYPVTFAIMLVSALITGTLANRLADSAREASRAAWRTKVLLETTQRLQQAPGEQEILRVVASQLQKLLGRPLVIWPVDDAGLGQPMHFAQDGHDFAGEDDVARWAFGHKKRAGASTDDHAAAEGLYLTIRSVGEAFGVVGFPARESPLEPFEHSVLLSILGEAALAMESRRNAREKEAAAVQAKNEQLRANLLRSISHDLRTPLTAISGNAENLLNNGEHMEHEDRKRMLSDIFQDSIWLIRLVENLLAITRIGEGRTQLRTTTELIDDVVQESLRHIRRRGTEHEIRVDMGDELLLANMDARLISQVIVNLVENAMKYTPSGSHIRITARHRGQTIEVSVADDGPGIRPEAKPRVFELFYSGSHTVADSRRSMGLGLALCRSIITLHGGEITLTDNQPSGCIFTFTLPASEVTLND